MTKMILAIDGTREGYTPKQCRETMTVGELMALLSDYDEETPIYISNDNGYTYGSIGMDSLHELEADDFN